MSARSIAVSWDEVPPMDQNGIVTMYQVLYLPLETYNGTIGAMMLSVQVTSVLLPGLQEFTNYSISIRAHTSVGAGPYSRAVVEMTSVDGKVT